MVTPLQTLGHWFTGGKKPRQPPFPPNRPPPVPKRMSGHTHTYELEKTRSGKVSLLPFGRSTLALAEGAFDPILQNGHQVHIKQSSRIPEGPRARREHAFQATYDGPRHGKDYDAFNRMSDRRNDGLPYTYSLDGQSNDGRASAKGAKVEVSPARSGSSKGSSTDKSGSKGSNPSAQTHTPRPVMPSNASDRSIHSWRAGVSKAAPLVGPTKLAFDPTPALLAEELDIQSRRTAAVPAPCHVTIFPPGPQKAFATTLKPPKMVMRTATGQSAGPPPATGQPTNPGGMAGFPPFPPFPAFPTFPVFPSFPAFPTWPNFPAAQAQGR